MSLIGLLAFALVGTFAIAGVALAFYASLPEKFLMAADRGRYAGLAASPPAQSTAHEVPALIGSLENQSA
jgi:hypothetical protein